MEQTRKFKIIVNSKECGTCSGATPSTVAKNVVKKLCGSSSKVVQFSLKECKRGCERVCGPYQGRMEKLDRPFKRSGKTITHRVVCGKVRKMRGGALSEGDFEKRDIDGEFRIKYIFFRPYIFFGVSDNNFYKYVVFADHFDNNFHYLCKNLPCEYNNFVEELKKLKSSMNRNINKNKFKRIRFGIDNFIKKKFFFKYYDDSMIFLYENIDDRKKNYTIGIGIGNGNLTYNNKTFCILDNQNRKQYPMITKDNIDTIGLCKYLKEEDWEYFFEERYFSEKGKLIDIIKRKYPESNILLFESLEKLHSMCFPLLEPFNEITNNQ